MVVEQTEDSDFEIMDVENYRSDKLQLFNHQVLIMECLRRCNEAGSHELRSGWFNEKMDIRGNINRTYIEDTRKKFIETVRVAMINLSCDFDGEAKKNIKEILEELEKTKKNLLADQWKWWESLTSKYKSIYVMKDEDVKSPIAFNQNLLWWHRCLEEEVKCFHKIFMELVQLTKRLDFYRAEEFIG